jgi:hypothetical protein
VETLKEKQKITSQYDWKISEPFREISFNAEKHVYQAGE